MSRAAYGSLMVTALAVALVFRLAGLDLRPMHHDEANQAVKFGELVETGNYRYDRTDHHGPSLYYLTLPSAWLRGQTTLASLDERTLRAVPALFGAGVVLLCSLLAGGLGRTATATGALLMACSPVLTYYSRFYIQEPLFVFFALAFLIALGHHVQRPRAASALAAGVFAGLAYSTKETSVIVLSAAVVASAITRRWTKMPRQEARRAATDAARGLAVAVSIAFVLYSSFFRYPVGLLESFRAFTIYVERGLGAGLHAQPWHYYLSLLTYSASGGLVWTEGLVLVLALVGIMAAFRKSSKSFWPIYIGLYSLLTALAFSAVPYKTPWNVLPFYVGFVLMAGLGAAALFELARSRVVRRLVVLALVTATWHLGVQNWRANITYPADPRNPYVYAQTSMDYLRLVQRVVDLSLVHPDRVNMLVTVIAGPYEQWPLPWYLRHMTRIGYWSRAAEADVLDRAPVIVASQENTEAVDPALGDRYVSEFYGLRPDVILTVYIERTLWQRLLESR